MTPQVALASLCPPRRTSRWFNSMPMHKARHKASNPLFFTGFEKFSLAYPDCIGLSAKLATLSKQGARSHGPALIPAPAAAGHSPAADASPARGTGLCFVLAPIKGKEEGIDNTETQKS